MLKFKLDKSNSVFSLKTEFDLSRRIHTVIDIIKRHGVIVLPDFVEHTIQPIYNDKSRILILGTMPSPKSREYGFYYSHPQNRFWHVVSDLLGQKMPKTNEEKTSFLLNNHIAMWDVLKSCDINGADDNSIKNPVANDLTHLLQEIDIKAIYTTGTKATALYKRLCLPVTGITSVYLPSTSPANCRHFTYEKLLESYQIIRKDLY